MGRVAALLAAVLAIAGGLAACGEDGAEPGAPRGATLVLDFQPNAVHAPLYAAQANGYFTDEGLDLDIREPSGTADGAKLVQAGRADLAILDINDLGIARARGLNLVAFAAIVQRPLASVIAGDADAFSEPKDLAGATVGVTGVPSDDAVLDTVLEAGGLRPDAVSRVTIGFSAVPALANGRVDAATAFWNAEGVDLSRLGIEAREFRVDELGAPRYPELVIVARGDMKPQEAQVACSTLAGLERAYADLGREPDAVLEAMLDAVPGADPDAQRTQFRELIDGDAFSPDEGASPEPTLTAGGYRSFFRWVADRDFIQPEPAAGSIRSGFSVDQGAACERFGAG